MNNVLVALKFGNEFVFQFFVHPVVSSFCGISSTSYTFVTTRCKKSKRSIKLLADQTVMDLIFVILVSVFQGRRAVSQKWNVLKISSSLFHKFFFGL